jgi:molecular chaperone Hsp33
MLDRLAGFNSGSGLNQPLECEKCLVNDYMIRLMAKEAGIRGLICVTTNLVKDAQQRHGASPAATAALGYGLTAAALLGSLLKVQQRVALKLVGNGPLQKMIVEADSYGRVRGYVAVPDVTLPPSLAPDDLAGALGDQGLLTVVKDLRMKELYESTVPFQTGQLDTDLIYYLMQSEQVPSLVEIGVKLNSQGELAVAGGLLFQLLPQADPTALRNLAERLEDMPPLRALLADGYTPEKILAVLFTGVPYEILESHPLRFECSCSWARSEKALHLLNREDLAVLLEEGQAVIDCHFCGQRYIFGREALETILEDALNDDTGSA